MAKLHTHCFYKQRFFLTQPQCCLAFSYIELKMLLSCVTVILCNHHTETIIIHFKPHFHCH